MMTPVIQPVVQTERLTLRPPTAADWEGWRPFIMSDRAQYVGGPCDLGRGWRALASIIGHWTLRGYGTFVITMKGDDRGIGGAGPWFPMNWPEPEIGWTIWDPAFEGLGIAHEAALATRNWARENLGWDRPVSYIDEANIRSAALAERLGAVDDPGAPTPGNDGTITVYRHPGAGA